MSGFFNHRVFEETGLNRHYHLSFKQKEFCVAAVKGEIRYCAYIGGYGSGKTHAGCIAAINLCMMYPGNRGVIASGTERQLADTCERQFFEQLRDNNLDGQIVEHNRADRRLLLANGSEVLFRSMEAWPRLLSLNLGWFWIDEAATVDPEGFKALMGRLRLRGPWPHVGLVTSNPDNGWLREVFRDRAWTDDVLLVSARTESNPYLPKGYAEGLRKAFKGNYAKRFLDGEFTPMEGRVYPDFDFDRHVVRGFTPPPTWKRYRAIDFGFANPFVCLFLAESPDGQIVLYDEYVASGRLLSQHALEIKRRGGEQVFETTWADHDAQDRAQLAAEGVETVAARKDLIAGIAEVVRAIGETVDGAPRLAIDARCRTTLEEIAGYRWESGGTREAPVKANDHCMDALRYAIYSRVCQRRANGPALLTAPRRKLKWSLK